MCGGKAVFSWNQVLPWFTQINPLLILNICLPEKCNCHVHYDQIRDKEVKGQSNRTNTMGFLTRFKRTAPHQLKLRLSPKQAVFCFLYYKTVREHHNKTLAAWVSGAVQLFNHLSSQKSNFKVWQIYQIFRTFTNLLLWSIKLAFFPWKKNVILFVQTFK